jgi:hypothetical protein
MPRFKTTLWICACLCALGRQPSFAQADPISGVYRLTTRAQQGMALDVAGGNVNANGTTVQLWYANRSANQQWLVERQADGSYKVYAFSGQNSLQMLDLTNGLTATGTAVKTYEDNGNAAQLWYFKSVGGAYCRVIPKNAGLTSNQTLEVVGGPTAGAGAVTAIGAYSGGDNQVFRLDWAGVSRILPNPKKGLGGRENKVPYLNGSWFYTWGGDRPANTPTGVEFVPMEWGYYGNANNGSVNWLNYVKSQSGVRTILGFNEPDSTTQANLSVAYALGGWQYLVGTGLPLGSPATVHADNQWMKDFMAGCATKNYRVDYVCIHWYGGNDPWGFLGHVEYIHNLYGKPVWITEFAPADWSGNRGISPQQCADFARIVLPELSRRSYVQRYAWFSAGTGDAALGAAALVNDDGTLTDLGRLYGRL